MNRRVLFILTLLICLARLLPQCLSKYSPPCCRNESALSARAKQPFPFNAKQLIKKRLASPPEMQHGTVFQGLPDRPPPANPWLPAGDIWPLHQLSITAGNTLFPPALVDWCTRAIEQNVFHPPPGGRPTCV